MIALKILAACIVAGLLVGAWLWLEVTVLRYGPPAPLARHCPFCGHWASEADRWLHEEGAQVTSFCCPACEAQMYRDYAIDPSEAA
jgi:hypothetical protein